MAIWPHLPSFDWSTLPGPVGQKLKDFALSKTIEYISVVVLWQLRHIIVDPVVFIAKYAFSDKYRNMRRLCGDYLLYHNPLMPEIGQIIPTIGQRIRVTRLVMNIGLRSSTAQQYECKGHRELGYTGNLEIKREFIFIHCNGVMSRYIGNQKFIVLYRQQYSKRSRSKRRFPFFRASGQMNVGTCGLMVGIAHNNNIYKVPVLVSRMPLTYDEADEMLKGIDRLGVTIPASVQIRGLLEKIPVNREVPLDDFESPFT
jgi:hypothetical protein